MGALLAGRMPLIEIEDTGSGEILGQVYGTIFPSSQLMKKNCV